jgi:hypothetical protein
MNLPRLSQGRETTKAKDIKDLQQRGRKPGGALAGLVVPFPQGERPKPPKYLNEAERAEWDKVVGRMPAGYFTPGTWALLECYVVHVALSRGGAAAYIPEFRPRQGGPADGPARHAVLADHEPGDQASVDAAAADVD